MFPVPCSFELSPPRRHTTHKRPVRVTTKNPLGFPASFSTVFDDGKRFQPNVAFITAKASFAPARSLQHRHSTIHMQGSTRNVTGLGAGQIYNRRSNLFGRPHPPGGHLRQYL